MTNPLPINAESELVARLPAEEIAFRASGFSRTKLGPEERRAAVMVETDLEPEECASALVAAIGTIERLASSHEDEAQPDPLHGLRPLDIVVRQTWNFCYDIAFQFRCDHSYTGVENFKRAKAIAIVFESWSALDLREGLESALRWKHNLPGECGEDCHPKAPSAHEQGWREGIEMAATIPLAQAREALKRPDGCLDYYHIAKWTDADFSTHPEAVRKTIRWLLDARGYALAALSPAPPPEKGERIPSGWKLVPVEPTEAMLAASWKATSKRSRDDYMAMELCSDPRERHSIKMKTRYAAMLSASPQPAKAEDGWLPISAYDKAVHHDHVLGWNEQWGVAEFLRDDSGWHVGAFNGQIKNSIPEKFMPMPSAPLRAALAKEGIQ